MMTNEQKYEVRKFRLLLLALALCLAAVLALAESKDGKAYKSVKVGKRTWMAENLSVETGNSWCYGDNSFLCGKYGRLYDWETAKAACPAGWHLPNREEWADLVERAGGLKAGGKKLKAAREWEEGGGGKDSYGFSAMPGGYRKLDGDYSGAGRNGRWWTATERDGAAAYNRSMYYNSDFADEYGDDKGIGFSVKCVKD